MLNDNQYINSVWEKYYKAESQARENQKYSYRFYKKEKIKFFIKSFVCTLATIFSTIGFHMLHNLILLIIQFIGG